MPQNRPEPKFRSQVLVSEAASKRTLPKPTFGLIAHIVLLTIILGFLITVIPGVRANPGYSELFDGVWQCAAFFAAAILCTIRIRGSSDRRSWQCVAVALYTEAVAETIWFWTQTDEDDPGSAASIADAVWMSFYILMLAALVILVRSRVNRSTSSVLVDALLVGLGGAAAGAAIVGPLLTWSDAGFVANLTNISYPVLDLILLTFALAVVTVYHWRPPIGVWLLAIGLVTWGMADSIYFVQIANESHQSGALPDALFVIAATTTALGPGWHRRPAIPTVPGWLPVVAPLVAVAVAVTVLILRDFLPIGRPAKWLALAAILAASIRLTIGYFEARRSADDAHLARTDELTGLLNRRGFFRAHALLFETEEVTRHAVFLLDFDRFKDINDSLGHHIGDELLQTVARRINFALRDEDLVARFGGDEFVIAAPVDGRHHTRELAQAIYDSVTAPAVLDELEVQLGVSIGIAVCPDDGTDTISLLRHADQAMFDSKRMQSGPVFYEFDDRDRQRRTTGREGLRMLAEFRTALRSRRLDLHFQPIVDVRSGTVVGAEALLRWNHPVHGTLGPAELLPLAVRHNLMPLLTRVVLELALAEAASWRRASHNLSVSVNVSPSMVDGDDLSDALSDLKWPIELPRSALVIELTEDNFIDDYPATRKILDGLRAEGYLVSFDDFGQGHSILAHLCELSVDEVKLDRSFVDAVSSDLRVATIVRAITTLAHDLGMRVVAEGVETRKTFEVLRGFGCDLAQGHFLSKPLPGPEFAKFVADYQPRTALSVRD